MGKVFFFFGVDGRIIFTFLSDIAHSLSGFMIMFRDKFNQYSADLTNQFCWEFLRIGGKFSSYTVTRTVLTQNLLIGELHVVGFQHCLFSGRL